MNSQFRNAACHTQSSSVHTHNCFDSKRRQVARIIKHLNNTLLQEHTIVNSPSDWIIDCLIFNCPKEDFAGNEWYSIVSLVLQRLKNNTQTNSQHGNFYTQLDGITPLFPNNESFNKLHTNRFSNMLLQYLEQDSI